MSIDRHLKPLMRQIAAQDEIEIAHPGDPETAAALVYVAECYGFRYAGLSLVGKHKALYVRLTRDPDPAARQRAAANVAAFPDPGKDRPVPGMYLGSLQPVPETQPQVDLLLTLIRYDMTLATANRRQLLTMAWGSAAMFLLLAPLTGKYLVLLPLAVLVPLFLLGALRLNAAKRAKLAARLTAAGWIPVRDAEGVERFVRPAA
ncbi:MULTISPECIES: hypothetical protein [unclassified Streptomyces]|uniref:hypothetical protein n=1 Tax=unclassified Streptomyces TaxID=2593676 RepID=UPI001661B7D0|nr:MULTISPECIES: hypothetical protein [unclassified Streptomyces]MBD0839190.1 hypothetical protein [Streptomyces sp. TRM68416]